MALTLNNNLNTLKVGDYFWCKYTATANAVGTFSELATKTDAEATPVIPVVSSNVPNGYFKFIMVEDWNGKKRLIADRNIQHSISWDVLNSSGIASGSGLPNLLPEINDESGLKVFTIRLLTGGTHGTDKDNEWDKHIADSTLGGAITAGDDSVWNWSGMRSISSTSVSTNTNRASRGRTTASTFSNDSTFYTGTVMGFRPLLEIEIIFNLLNKSFILLSDGYKKWKEGSQYKAPVYKDVNAIPKMTSNTSPSGIASASSIAGVGNDSWYAFDKSDFTSNNNAWIAEVYQNTAWLAYEFPSEVAIWRYSIYPQANALTRSPKAWTFEGYDGSSWVVLDTRSNIINWSNGLKKSFDISTPSSFKKYRINMTENNGDTDFFYAIQEIEMFQTEFEIPATPSSFKTVSPTLPTLTQFQTEGMDDLSVFDRKIQTVGESPKSMTSSVLGVGKVYKSSVDLKKIFDLRKIEVK